MLCIVLGIFIFVPLAALASQEMPKPNPAAETWIRDRLSQGLPADLAIRFPDQHDRVIDGKFLSTLLKEFAQKRTLGVRLVIANAVVIGNVFLEDFNLNSVLVMRRCRFLDDVDLNRSVFANGLWLDGSQFTSVSFNGASIRKSLDIRDAVFAGKVDFTCVKIDEGLEAKGVTFGKGGQVSFNSARIERVFLDGSQFLGKADFGNAIIERRVQALQTKFTEFVSFAGIHIGGEVILNGSHFLGGVDFGNARIADGVSADDCKFLDRKTGVLFHSMKITRSLSLQRSLFNGPVSFGGTIIEGQLFLQNAKFTDKNATISFPHTVEKGVFLSKALFEGGVVFSHGRIGGGLVLDDAHFTNRSEKALFDYMKIDGLVSLQNARFDTMVSFARSCVSGFVDGRSAEFRNDKATLLNGLQVSSNLIFNGSVFHGPVDLTTARISGQLQMIRTVFADQRAKIDFNAVRVGDGSFFHDTQFSGKAFFTSMRVDGNLELLRTSFRGEANFGGIEVGGRLVAHGARFDGKTGFPEGKIGGRFEANEAQFMNQDHGVSFNNLQTAGILIQQGKFLGPVDFMLAKTGVFVIYDSLFENTAHPVDFRAVRVQVNLVLDKTKFLGSAKFDFAHIAGNFSAVETEWASGQELFLRNVSIGGRTIFKNVTLSSRINSEGASLQDVVFENIRRKENAPAMGALDLSQAVIKGTLKLESCDLARFAANSLTVQGPTVFKKINVSSEIILEGTRFTSLILSDLSYSSTCKIRIHGMHYDSISGAGNDETQFVNWFTGLLRRSEYDSGAYLRLESFLKNRGQIEMADQVNASRTWRERNSFLGKIWNGFLQVFTYHGRMPWLAFAWALLPIAFGMRVFRKRNMELIDNDKKCHYSSFWYAVGLLIPFVRLQVVAFWQPRQDKQFARNWAYIHQLMGWALLSIGVLTFAGMIK